MDSLLVLNCQGIGQNNPHEAAEDSKPLRLGHLSWDAACRKTRTAAVTAAAGEAAGRDAGLSDFAAAVDDAVVSGLFRRRHISLCVPMQAKIASIASKLTLQYIPFASSQHVTPLGMHE